ncbi:hypothetical protein DEM91_06195 [Prevotella sp. TCVGH]|jgi:hypothetical protein|uniref:Uncharacterized protein n=2 Tax=Hoylesella timonensis TaxID=386414 RepID=A0A098YT97_9BACT|nr:MULTISPECIES: hypothetical protein [Prevotellaceae]KGI22527.1 hypothetical protein HMPREF9304_03700 [Hoylesella timonensis S9-PR14]MCL6748231.1 hypothetical protein [Prevotella sp. TCVGH]PMC11424.1 hypothetical protein CJ232_01370 [Hoylesella timonensis]
MNANEKTLSLFTTRVRQMILQYQEMKQENDGLYEMVDEQNAKIKELEAQLEQAKQNYNSLKMARMIQVSNVDMDVAKKKLSKLIRDVNKCITLLSGK